MISERTLAACRILIVGDVALDRFVYGEVARISPEAPVPVLRVTSTTNSPGCAANVAANVTALEAQATLIGLGGDDITAVSLAKVLRGIKHLKIVPDTDRPRRSRRGSLQAASKLSGPTRKSPLRRATPPKSAFSMPSPKRFPTTMSSSSPTTTREC